MENRWKIFIKNMFGTTGKKTICSSQSSGNFPSQLVPTKSYELKL